MRTMIGEVQSEMEGLLSGKGQYEPVVIGITNYPYRIEDAMLRRLKTHVPL